MPGDELSSNGLGKAPSIGKDLSRISCLGSMGGEDKLLMLTLYNHQQHKMVKISPLG